jgi:DNA (cytosine-5)-methyltransferase 1
MKVLNLYAGIGGNRKLWEDVEVTAVEFDPKIARVYQDFFPKDKMFVGDAHQYLLDHFGEFDFIWSSRPCVSHSRINVCNMLSPYKDNTKQMENGGAIKPRYPDMALYEEVIFLKHFFKGKWCVENVIAYYEALIRPQELGKHWFWSNFYIRPINLGDREHHSGNKKLEDKKGFDLSAYVGLDKRALLRNCVEPELGLHVLNESKRDIHPELFRTRPAEGQEGEKDERLYRANLERRKYES